MSRDVKVTCDITPGNLETLTWDVSSDVGDFYYDGYAVATSDLKGFIAVLQAILDAKSERVVCSTCYQNPCVCPEIEEGGE